MNRKGTARGMQLTSLFSKGSYYTCMCITQISKSDGYSQFSVDADFVGMGSLNVGVALEIFHYFYLTTLKFLDVPQLTYPV